MRQKACTSTNEPLVTTGRRADSGKAFQGLHVCNESSTCTKDTLESACFPLEAFSDSELSHDQRSTISEKSPFHSLTPQTLCFRQEVLINTSRYADGTIGPLAAFLALHNYDAQLMLKKSCDRLRGEPHQGGNVARHGLRSLKRSSCGTSKTG